MGLYVHPSEPRMLDVGGDVRLSGNQRNHLRLVMVLKLVLRKGSILVEFDPRDYQVAVDQARADLANAEATAQSLHIDVPITATASSHSE
jgi:nitrogen-specific signal transduction histidine kinase